MIIQVQCKWWVRTGDWKCRVPVQAPVSRRKICYTPNNSCSWQTAAVVLTYILEWTVYHKVYCPATWMAAYFEQFRKNWRRTGNNLNSILTLWAAQTSKPPLFPNLYEIFKISFYDIKRKCLQRKQGRPSIRCTRVGSLPCADWPITKGLIFTKSATLSTIHFNTRLIR